MIRSLWIAKTGMEAQQTKLDVVSNNLSNVSTTGFKRGQAMFEDLMYQNMRQVGANAAEQAQLPTGLQLGLGVRTVATARDFSQGGLQQTGNHLDVAITGGGFFQVQMPDGTIGYTRDGSFKLDAQGQLVTNNGLPVAGGVQVPPDARSVTIHADGRVEVTRAGPGGEQPQPIGQIELASFVNPAGLEPLGQNLYAETAASGAPGQDGLGALKQGFLETSNVNVVEELVSMIQTQRAYELNSKAIQTSDQMLQRLGQL
ncbi:flagellar basal-body rod protein FlgG [Caldimonas tepidiphila]|uniref:flagellar basal-body rod protein FlgG n=1 Tax=Caldimonas tepidiphila TaxID=2315841 RepID=UPI000E5C5027|nr:flagellar basal-body rod protein FlgG [Caldimonas tepidiphila]